jgi:UDP-glucose:glycoprotein glucosyltransferase
MYPGQFHQIKLNLFNVVLAVDLSQTSSLNFMGGAVSTIIGRGFPFRFGVVPVVETEDGKKMARFFKHLIDNYGKVKTMSVIKTVSASRLVIVT